MDPNVKPQIQTLVPLVETFDQANSNFYPGPHNFVDVSCVNMHS